MSRPETRFAHSEGITDLAQLSEAHGSIIVTCGSDGDIRVWQNFEDEDPVTFSASDSCLAISTHENIAYIGTENHTIEAFELPHGKSLGVKTKFTAGVNHIDISSDGKLLAAGAGDMTIQLIALKDSGIPTKKIEGAHRAPILSVAIDPTSKFLASSGCDGTVCVWCITINSSSMVATLAKKWENVFSKTSDVLLSPTLCRMAWSPGQGNQLAFPNNANQIAVYSRDKWVLEFTLSHKCLQKLVSVVRFSACGKYIAAGGAAGSVLVWELSTKKCVYFTDENKAITGLIFAPNNGLYMTDDQGRFLYLPNFIKSSGTSESTVVASKSANGASTVDDDMMKDMFDDGMDEIFDIPDDDDDDENSISISKIKAEVGFIEDEYVGVDKAAKGIKPIHDEDSNMSAPAAPPKVIYQAPVNPFTDPQPTFQPSSTPVRLDHRFMVWNTVAIIRNYTTDDDEEAIDVEFHDATFHTAIHLRNQFSFTMAVISSEAAVFACEKGDGHPSKLFCLNFSTWDKSKEWTIDMPKGENINCIAIGKGWIVAFTSLNRLRLFSIGGVQKFVYDWANQIVTMSGNEDLLFIASHCGVGINGNQSLTYTIVKVKDLRLQPLINESPLPLTPKSILTWIGFSDEGTPVMYDSKDTLRMLNGSLWTPLCCMREYLNGPNNHFWVVGVSETSQNIRAIKCKGNKYPPTIPRPTIMLIDTKIPICELDTEKSQLEDGLLKSNLLKSVANKMDRKGFDMDDFKEQADTVIRENLMKLFALSTKGDRDFRAAEYVSLMPSSQHVQIAIKYASKLYRMALSEKLTAIGREKMELEDIEEPDDYDFETQNKTNYIHISSMGNGNTQNDSLAEEYLPSQNTSYQGTSSALQTSRNSFLSETLSTLEENPIMKEQRDAIRAVIEPIPIVPASRNPFKKGEDAAKDASENGKGMAFIDAWKRLPDKPTLEFNPKNPLRKQTGKNKADKDKDPKEKIGGRGKRKSDKDASDLPAASNTKKQRTLDMHVTKTKAADRINSNPCSPALSGSVDEDSVQPSPKPSEYSEVEAEENEYGSEEELVVVQEADADMDEHSRDSNASEGSVKKRNGLTGRADEKKSHFASKLQLFAKPTDEETY